MRGDSELDRPGQQLDRVADVSPGCRPASSGQVAWKYVGRLTSVTLPTGCMETVGFENGSARKARWMSPKLGTGGGLGTPGGTALVPQYSPAYCHGWFAGVVGRCHSKYSGPGEGGVRKVHAVMALVQAPASSLPETSAALRYPHANVSRYSWRSVGLRSRTLLGRAFVPGDTSSLEPTFGS